MQIIPMRDLKNTVEVERRCAEENGPVFVTKNGYGFSRSSAHLVV